MSKSNGFHAVHGSAEDIAIGPLHGTVVAIGNFDGVHRGHRAVIGAALKRAKALGRSAAALTFSPHPRLFLRPQDTLFQLSSARDKLRLLAASGLNGAIVMNFDAQLAATSAADFIERILVGRFGIGGAAIGFDFHFGHKRTGSPAYLAEQGARLGFAVDIVAPLEDEGRPVSSGAVRTALSQGKVVEATELLGAPWFVSGEVDPRRQARARSRLPDRQHQARSVLRPQARHLRGARFLRGQTPRRRRQFRHAADVR